jgi:hypothetical protein
MIPLRWHNSLMMMAADSLATPAASALTPIRLSWYLKPAIKTDVLAAAAFSCTSDALSHKFERNLAARPFPDIGAPSMGGLPRLMDGSNWSPYFVAITKRISVGAFALP